jgi:hypothetical protein
MGGRRHQTRPNGKLRQAEASESKAKASEPGREQTSGDRLAGRVFAVMLGGPVGWLPQGGRRSRTNMVRHVRGSFFAEYVRMLRRRTDVDWESILPSEDVSYLKRHIDSDAWYPMTTFERLGVAILSTFQGATLDAVRMWGQFSASQYASLHSELIAVQDPVDTLMRLKVLRGTLFDFPAFDIPMLTDDQAFVSVHYRMGPVAEEAACVQTMGFCEGVLALAGAEDIRADFKERSWRGDARTLITLEWEQPRSSARRLATV